MTSTTTSKRARNAGPGTTPLGDPPLIGQDRLIELFENGKAQGNVGHAYLIEGAAGSGKRSLVAKIARSLICCVGERDACGDCSSCRKNVVGGLHQDLIRVQREETTRAGKTVKARNIKIDQIRAVQEILPFPPLEGRVKVIVIEEAERMGLEAQNALLKSLEEPPSQNVFFLLATNRSRLLPTVLSRCQLLTMTPLSDAIVRSEVTRRLPDADPTLVNEAVALAGGALGEALMIAHDDRWSALRGELARALDGGVPELLAFSKVWSAVTPDHNGPERAFRMLKEHLRRELATENATLEAFDFWEQLAEIEGYWRQNNVNARLSLEVSILRARRALRASPRPG
jgi:DNA polymerase III subunit delta'